MSTKPHLRRHNRIVSIHSSLKIEANSLSLNEVRDVIDGKHVLGPELEIREVANAYKAYSKIEDVNPYSIDDLKMMQGIMENGIQSDAGRFRDGEEGVFDGDSCIFMAPPAKRVPSLMENLFSWMISEKDTVHPLIMSAVFHYEFVFIHPFSDGNGRTARLWHNVLLTNWNPIFEYIPLESQIEKFQKGYYKAIADCNSEGRSDHFIEFMLERIDEILDEYIEQVTHSDEMLSEYVKRMLEAMDFGVPYTSSEIMKRLGLKSKETFRKNYMTPAMNGGLVVMTVPDKPRSRNQRYIKK
jgi:Uncharacterized conserved protein